MSLTNPPVLLSKESGIASVILNQPDSLNVLNAPMLNALEEAFLNIREDSQIRCVIVTGQGRAFSAGADLKEMNVLSPENAFAYARRGQSVLGMLGSLPIPSIAQLNGFALGGGCELALAATFRIASTTAAIALPELTLGVIPGFGGTQRLPRLIGLQAARQLILTGERLDAQAAHRIGLIDRVAEPDELSTITIEMAQKLASASRSALTAASRSLESALHEPSDALFEFEARQFAVAFDSPDRIEGLAAFFDKRPPNFR